MSHRRQIYLHGPLGQRHFREVLGSLLVSSILVPEPIWFVSPWVSDFPVLDNTNGQWNLLDPTWSYRVVSFEELLVKAINEGCEIKLATRSDERCRRFIQSLQSRLFAKSGLEVLYRNEIHIKGMLTSRYFLEGSMNFTFSGTNYNDEHIEIHIDPDVIRQAFFQFRDRYFIGGVI